MPALVLQLESEHEEAIDGWYVADGHWILEPEAGIGIILIVSPEMRARIKAGRDVEQLTKALVDTGHCVKVVLERQIGRVHERANAIGV